MRLLKVTLDSFRSIATKLPVNIRPELTCLIGANEHGKSNILQAIPLLREGDFGPNDRNTKAAETDDLPEIQFELALNSTDRKQLQDAVQSDIATLDEIERDEDAEKTYGILKKLNQ